LQDLYLDICFTSWVIFQNHAAVSGIFSCKGSSDFDAFDPGYGYTNPNGRSSKVGWRCAVPTVTVSRRIANADEKDILKVTGKAFHDGYMITFRNGYAVQKKKNTLGSRRHKLSG